LAKINLPMLQQTLSSKNVALDNSFRHDCEIRICGSHDRFQHKIPMQNPFTNERESVLERGEELDDTVVIMMLHGVAAQHDRSCAGAGGLDDTVVIMMLHCVAAQHDRSCAGAGGEAGRHCCNYDVALCCSTTQ
jgi:hypothetical protein